MARSDIHQIHLERLGNPPIVDFGKPLLQVSKGISLSSDDPFNSLMTSTMAWLCILAIEQNRTKFRAGTVSQWRQKARELETYIHKLNSFQSGTEETLALLQQVENWTDEQAAPHWRGLKSNGRTYWLECARKTGKFLLEVEKTIQRKGKRGRPVGSFTLDPILQEQDRVLLEEAINQSGGEFCNDREALNTALLEVVRKHLKLGDIRDYHTSADEHMQISISTHMKRLSRRLDAFETTANGEVV